MKFVDVTCIRPEVRSGVQTRIGVLLGLLTMSLLLWWHPILQLFHLAWKQEQYSYILLILPVSLYLLATEKSSHSSPTTAWLPGCFLLFTAGLIALCAALVNGSNRLSLAILSLIVFWIGSYVLCFGWRTVLELRFPVLFLFFLVPLPAASMDKVIFLLQYGSTQVVYFLFRLFGIPVAISGFELSLPGLNIEVAKECSGIRSSCTLLVTSVVLSYLYLRSSWRQAVVWVLVLPLTIIKNGFRVFVLSVLAVYEDPSWLDGRLHRNGGVLFFALALLIVGGMIAWLQRGEEKTDKAAVLRRPLLEAPDKLSRRISVSSPYRGPIS